MKRLLSGLFASLLLCQLTSNARAEQMAAPLGLGALSQQPWNTVISVVDDLPGTETFTAQLVSYQCAGLTLYALVVRPRTTPPVGGFPVIMANHGYHPDPPQYGISADGHDRRPGDYYRLIPGWFAQAGFAVVMADYRGHNRSQGFAYTQDPLATSYYTQDVLALMAALDQLTGINSDQLFLWGHSMGGEVTLKALLASQHPILGASLWSTVGGSVWDQAYYYEVGRQPVIQRPDSLGQSKSRLDTLRQRQEALTGLYSLSSGDPLEHLHRLATPVIIHHAVDDTSALFDWSAELAAQLYRLNKPYVFYAYSGADHLLVGDDAAQALARDLAFFRKQLAD